MHSALTILLASGAAALPQISLPPLIPKIPGVTVPLAKNAPPLPILQIPTPALPNPKFKGSNLKPKKIGYFWVGAGDNEHADFLAVHSLDDATFGEFIWMEHVPTSGNSPHHSGPTFDGKTIYGGGLLSLLKTQDTGFYFDTTNPYRPKFIKSNRATLSSIADEVRAKPDGGFFITYMGSAAGTSPGRLVETDSNYNIIHQWPEDVEGTLSILDSQFSPHGLTCDYTKNIGITSDFVVPYTILKPTTGVQRAETLRLWDLKTMKIISKLTIPGADGLQDVKFIPGHPETAALTTAVGAAQVWAIYPFRKQSDGTQGVLKKIYDFGKKYKDGIAAYSDISQDGKKIYFTFTEQNHVAGLDITNLNKVKRLDKDSDDQGIIGPHYIKLAPDQKHLLVTDYFLQPHGGISIVNTPADYKAQWIDVRPDGTLHFNRSIDFEARYGKWGGARPHSAVVYDLTDPKNPQYY